MGQSSSSSTTHSHVPCSERLDATNPMLCLTSGGTSDLSLSCFNSPHSSRSSYSAGWADTNDEPHIEDTPGCKGESALNTATIILDLASDLGVGSPASRSCSPCSSRSSYSAGWSGAGSEYCIAIPGVVFSPLATNIAQRPSRRAVVVGINYTGANHKPDRRLRYSINDARRFASSLRGCGFPDEAVIVLTDQKHQEESKRATHGALLSWIDWLVRDSKAGDLLVFFFSGHSSTSSESSSLVMADGEPFDRELLHSQLILPIPANGSLHVMLDCCSASSMIELQHCVGRMATRALSNQITSASSLSETTSTGNAGLGRAPTIPDLWSSTPGRDVVTGLCRDSDNHSASVVPLSPSLDSSGPLTKGAPLRSARADQTIINLPVASLPRAKVWDESCGQQAMVQSDNARDYFFERPERFVKPAGTVMLWASAGVHQPTFEAYNGRDVRHGADIRNGIVTNAICTALDPHAGSGLLVRDLWHQIVDQVEEENDWRRERDAADSSLCHLNPFHREQRAELWVSQPEPLSTAGPILDQPVFSARAWHDRES